MMDIYPHTAGHTDLDTSKDAADAIEGSGKAWTLRREVLELLDQWDWDWDYDVDPHPKVALTADEIAQFLEESILSIRPRIAELHKQGKIEWTGQKRPSSTGRPSKVWRLVR